MKRIVCIILAMMMSMSSISTLAAVKDEPSGWAKEMVYNAIKAGVVPERLQGDYKKAITRGEFAELMVNVVVYSETFRLKPSDEFYFTKQDILNGIELEVEFNDAKEDYIKIAYILGIVNGVTETEFKPNKTVTRQEAAVMMANTYQHGMKLTYTMDNYKDNDKIASWAKDAVSLCFANGYMKGSNGCFRPTDTITREEAIYMAFSGDGKADTNVGLRAKGVVRLDPRYFDKPRFVIGKDYVYFKYSDQELDDYYLLFWNYYGKTKSYKNPTKDQTRMAYQCADIIFDSSLRTDIAKAEAKTKILTDFMEISCWGEKYLMKINFQKKKGYFSMLNGPSYGNPAKKVEYLKGN